MSTMNTTAPPINPIIKTRINDRATTDTWSTLPDHFPELYNMFILASLIIPFVSFGIQSMLSRLEIPFYPTI